MKPSILFAGLFCLAGAGCGEKPAPPAQPGGAVAKEDTGTPAATQLFLVYQGVGTVAEANAYYATNIAGFTPGGYTLERWKADSIGSQPTVNGLYRNAHELGFWRDMTCTKNIGRGVGGCMVTNYLDSNRTPPNVGTVTMNINAVGVTRFYVFGADGKIIPAAVLDSEGAKAVPRVCVVCHNGSYDGTANDLGAVFREFEPSRLDQRPGISPQQVQAEFFALNQAIRTANLAIRSEAEGAPVGTDHARTAVVQHVDDLYAGGTIALDFDDPRLVPPSWNSDHSPRRSEPWRTALWSGLVAPYCMPCHRTNSYDWSGYADFMAVAVQKNGKSLLRRLVTVDPADPLRTKVPFMPQAELTFNDLRADGVALTAIDQWEAATGQNNLTTFILSGAPAGVGDHLFLSGDAVQLGGFNLSDGLPLLANGSTFSATVSLPRGTRVAFKAAIVGATGIVTFEGGSNREILIPQTPTSEQQLTWQN